MLDFDYAKISTVIHSRFCANQHEAIENQYEIIQDTGEGWCVVKYANPLNPNKRYTREVHISDLRCAGGLDYVLMCIRQAGKSDYQDTLQV